MCTVKDSRGGKEKHQNTHDQYDNNHLMNDSLWVHQYVFFFFSPGFSAILASK